MIERSSDKGWDILITPPSEGSRSMASGPLSWAAWTKGWDSSWKLMVTRHPDMFLTAGTAAR